jgi:phosphate/sulfate permease
MTEIRNSVLAGLAFGLLFGIFHAVLYDINTAIVAGPIAGLAFGVAIYFFITSKIVDRQTQIENLNDKPIVRLGGANHFVNGEAVGGKLYLLEDRLQFQSHSFNIQNHGQVIKIQQIKKVSFYNTLGLIPNGLSISTFQGKTEKFVVRKRHFWKKEIEKLISNNK